MIERSRKPWEGPIYRCPTLSRPRIRLPNCERSRVAITGSPNGLAIEAYHWFFKMMDRTTFGMIDPIVLTYGHSNQRVDNFAQRWATSNWLTMMVYYLRESRGGLSKSVLDRNIEIVTDADYLIVFTDGNCQTTKQMIEYAKDSNIKTKVFRL